ncbi:uncharacterized protein PSFLO_03540 [Pseudozyma flocculosa]|uniref:Uncharacterized protein n=1 Tax=Pseudozyma flocculosa TaxID=84751 RepID=A0A5C3F0M0_9BASI|nr:uncharacterized protein PSFLO_03540 [Pseudozyma flocculosa]
MATNSRPRYGRPHQAPTFPPQGKQAPAPSRPPAYPLTLLPRSSRSRSSDAPPPPPPPGRQHSPAPLPTQLRANYGQRGAAQRYRPPVRARASRPPSCQESSTGCRPQETLPEQQRQKQHREKPRGTPLSQARALAARRCLDVTSTRGPTRRPGGGPSTGNKQAS